MGLGRAASDRNVGGRGNPSAARKSRASHAITTREMSRTRPSLGGAKAEESSKALRKGERTLKGANEGASEGEKDTKRDGHSH